VVFRTLRQEEQLVNPIVVDNSVMMRWLFQHGSKTDQTYAQDVLSTIGSEKLQVIVPYIWVYESAFVVEYYLRRDAKRYDECLEQLTWLFNLSMVIRGEEIPASLYDFSYTHGVSTYDSAYAMLALNQFCPIATLDKKIIKASDKAKFTLFEL